MVPKRRAIGYSKPYPDEYEMIPLPPKYRLPTSPNSVDRMAPAPSSTSADIWRNLDRRCRISYAKQLAVAGLATQLKDMASQADYPWLAHMVQKLSAYEQRHPDLYQDKLKRAVILVDAREAVLRETKK
ncbi:hypothetical protein QYE76_055875 [Lolium multiflorum]|uniref:Uncharacterized protein n=1 Tax=Lolium multiflorum TaxID=4521 RepID=A0AAD8T1V8_LOLMU|nr:hypothetical protein QYE76_055875 [Lolium multiflorum]